MYELRIPQKVVKFIKNLPEKYRNSAIEALQEIKNDPKTGKSLTSELVGLYSYEFGPYRVVYKFNIKEKVVNILKLNHRRLVYN